MIIRTKSYNCKKYNVFEHIDLIISQSYNNQTASIICPLIATKLNSLQTICLIVLLINQSQFIKIPLNSNSYNKNMSSLYRRDLSGTHSVNQKKKIKHFSYSESDRIGKGYSSIVYRGTNDHTSTNLSKQMRP